MNLFERPDFEAHVKGLVHAFVVHQWGGASVGKVGTLERSKIFAILSNWSTDAPAIGFKCNPVSYRMLIEQEGIRPSPYLARAGWVQVTAPDALDAETIAAYIANAHALAVRTLARKDRVALGLA